MNNKIKTLSMAIVILGILTINAMAEPISHKPNQRIDGTAYSSNWAGYAVHSGTYNTASGSWTVPTIQATVSGYSSAWVGIGGFLGNSVIQIGTEQDCAAGVVAGTDNSEKKYHEANDNSIANKPSTNGKTGSGGSNSCIPVYYAWWEMYPQNAEQPISASVLTVTPGDTMTASVSQNSNSSWTLTITDITTGKSFTTTQTPNFGFAPDQASAEMIMERPALCSAYSCKLTNLANFGTINFNSVSSNSVLFDSSADGIIMVDNGFKAMTTLIPNPITTSGMFSVKWVRNN